MFKSGGIPAVADRQVAEALVRSSEEVNPDLLVKEGMTLTLDVFYSGVLEFPHQLYKKSGVLAVEMENSALFVISALRRIQAGAILAIDGFADADLLEVYIHIRIRWPKRLKQSSHCCECHYIVF